MKKRDKKALRSLLTTYRDGPRPMYTHWLFRIVEFFVLVGIIVLARFMMDSTGGQSWTGLFLPVIVGGIIGVMSMLRASQSYVPLVRSFLDLDRIEKELENADG